VLYCFICEEEVMLCSNLVSAEGAWNLGLVNFAAEVWTCQPSLKTSFQAHGISRNRLFQLTRASYELTRLGPNFLRCYRNMEEDCPSSELLKG